MLHKVKTETVVFDKAVPASKLQVLLYLVTGGKRGRLFEREKTGAIKYSAPPFGLNCRCAKPARPFMSHGYYADDTRPLKSERDKWVEQAVKETGGGVGIHALYGLYDALKSGKLGAP